jgi:hypothetical protein
MRCLVLRRFSRRSRIADGEDSTAVTSAKCSVRGREVPGETSLLSGGDEVDELIDEEAIDLEEGAESDSVAAISGWVDQEIGAGVGEQFAGGADSFGGENTDRLDFRKHLSQWL